MKSHAEKKEARPDQVINLDQYRQAVLRDISLSTEYMQHASRNYGD